MEKAKAAVSHFVSKSGHHDTNVQERTAPAVQQEQVKPTRHEEVQEAVDREVHQDHHHTTVQPVHDREVLPEKHHHNMAPVTHKEFSHDNHTDTQRKLDETASQFKNTSRVHDTKHTTDSAPRVEGEHVHHHVHETVQPVIHKETITPEVVHTTVPVHETHHAGAEHHGTSVLPMKEMHEFTSGGGALSGGKESSSSYDGCPRPYNESMQLGRTEADGNPHLHSSPPGHESDGNRALSGTGTTNTTTATGPHASNITNKADPRVDGDRDGSHHLGGTDSRPTPGTGNQVDSRMDNSRHGEGVGNTTTSHTKPSMMDKLNPMKDSDGDGKRGLMD